MSSFFGRLLSGQKGDLGYPLASRMTKIATFALYVDEIREERIPLSLPNFISWSNSWLAPELRVADTGRKIAVYDDKPVSGSRKKYYQESYKWFNRNLTVASKYKVTYNGLTDKEKEVHHYLAQGLVDGLREHLLRAAAQGGGLGTFDANGLLQRLWKSSVGDLDETVESSLIDRL
jgi:hypothetical protein